ncbi:hypothetical protein [Oceanobacillus manasiensis]|uniref:hypothetical protein n=1 Tax=Oceanobacillus manasiensis TaxID=586413 RepID=UPI0005A848CA|nr:hypothetical protein [Oceanobacillus manasiensis]
MLNKDSSLDELHDTQRSTQDLLFILDDLFFFSIDKYDQLLRKETEKLFEQMHVPEVLFDQAFPQIIWWLLFCYPQAHHRKTIYQDYLEVHNEKWQKTNKVVRDHLDSWLSVVPGFYRVVKIDSQHKRLFHVQDVFLKRRKRVFIFNEIFQTPKMGEIISGMLLPVGNNVYTTQGRLFLLPITIAPEIMARLQQFVEMHKSNLDFVVTAPSYPALLRIVMQTMEEKL